MLNGITSSVNRSTVLFWLAKVMRTMQNHAASCQLVPTAQRSHASELSMKITSLEAPSELEWHKAWLFWLLTKPYRTDLPLDVSATDFGLLHDSAWHFALRMALGPYC